MPAASGLGACPPELGGKFGKLPLFDGSAYPRHQFLVVVQFVYGIEAGAEYLAQAVQVVP